MPTFGWGANEPKIKPVAQGGDTIGGYATKVKNAISNLFDTLNMFPWANATQSSAGFMSKDDKKAVDGIADLGTFNKMFFSQSSGSYTAPRTGVFRITLKGGGGGGGGAQTTTGKGSGGGGEGAINVIYANLTKSQSYPYVVGAGGTAGVSSPTYADVTHGAAGGTSSIIIDGTTYTALGGAGGFHSQSTARGGVGGGTSSGGLSIPGANGLNGFFDGSLTYALAQGGGHQGSIGSGINNAQTGGGGAGGFNTTPATDGAAGFILIEYAD